MSVSCNVLLVFFHKVHTDRLYLLPYTHVQCGVTFEALQEDVVRTPAPLKCQCYVLKSYRRSQI